MTLHELLREFFASAAGTAALGVLVVAVLDFVLGVMAAVRDDVFELSAVAAFLRKHILGRVLPIWLLLFVGYITNGLEFGSIPLILGVGIGAAGVYVAETLGDVFRTWGPDHQVQAVPTD
jgi:hypothetical protein